MFANATTNYFSVQLLFSDKVFAIFLVDESVFLTPVACFADDENFVFLENAALICPRAKSKVRVVHICAHFSTSSVKDPDMTNEFIAILFASEDGELMVVNWVEQAVKSTRDNTAVNVVKVPTTMPINDIKAVCLFNAIDLIWHICPSSEDVQFVT